MGNWIHKSEEIKEEKEFDEHTITLEELFQRLEVNPETGLSMTEAQRRYDRDGPNAMTPPKHYYEAKNAPLLEDLKNVVPKNVVCVRDGEKHTLPGEQLCVGDIIEIKAGDIVPADVRILEATDFRVDTSMITGQSGPQSRSPENTHDNPLEATNLALLPSRVLEGTCKGIVIKIGMATINGQCSGLATVLG